MCEWLNFGFICIYFRSMSELWNLCFILILLILCILLLHLCSWYLVLIFQIQTEASEQLSILLYVYFVCFSIWIHEKFIICFFKVFKYLWVSYSCILFLIVCQSIKISELLYNVLNNWDLAICCILYTFIVFVQIFL